MPVDVYRRAFDWLTVKQAALVSGLSEAALRGRIRRGVVPVIPQTAIGGRGRPIRIERSVAESLRNPAAARLDRLNFILRLRESERLTCREVAERLGISRARAHQLWADAHRLRDEGVLPMEPHNLPEPGWNEAPEHIARSLGSENLDRFVAALVAIRKLAS